MKKVILALLIINLTVVFSAAQTADGRNDTQSWNDFQVTVPMSKQMDFYLAVTARFGSNITEIIDERLTLGFNYKPNKTWSIMPFYSSISARNSSGRFRAEHRLNLRVGYRFPFKKFGLSHRSTFEYRMRRSQNSWRYRPSLTFEKELPEKLIPTARLFLTEEIFYDSLLKKFSRNRFSVGVTKTLTKKLALDVYYMRQNDGFSRPGDLNVVGTSWKLRL